jgi:glycosyltransferase involved in cell wall biosynthesis
MSKSILVAFGSVPKDGGTFTFYRNLRRPLLEHGIDLRCVSVGRQEAELWEPAYADDGCVLLAAETADGKAQAVAFVDWCRREAVDIVIAVNSIAILSALPHLPEDIRTIARCANAFDHGYRITMSCYDRLSRIVALAPRQVDDLISRYGASVDRITLIPNGTSVTRFAEAAAQTRGKGKALRLGFLGRLEHNQKGVLFLPDILRRLQASGVDFSFEIAGKGVHEAALRRELTGFLDSGLVRFAGALNRDQIADFFGNVDVYLFPSQFEGSPNALIEAMMAGCVPAAWKLDGITDFLIEDGATGVLADVGDCVGLADKITRLAVKRDTLKLMAEAAGSATRKRFSLERLLSDYLKLLDVVMAEPARPWQARSWERFRVDPAFRQPIWRRLVPGRMKRAIRRNLFRLRLVNRDA